MKKPLGPLSLRLFGFGRFGSGHVIGMSPGE